MRPSLVARRFIAMSFVALDKTRQRDTVAFLRQKERINDNQLFTAEEDDWQGRQASQYNSVVERGLMSDGDTLITTSEHQLKTAVSAAAVV